MKEPFAGKSSVQNAIELWIKRFAESKAAG